MPDDPSMDRPPTLDEFQAQMEDDIRQVIRAALDDIGYDRPKALLLQLADQGQADGAARTVEQQAVYDSLNEYERRWFDGHQVWDGEIVTSEEFLRRLRAQQDASPEPASPARPFHLASERAAKRREIQMDMF